MGCEGALGAAESDIVQDGGAEQVVGREERAAGAELAQAGGRESGARGYEAHGHPVQHERDRVRGGDARARACDVAAATPPIVGGSRDAHSVATSFLVSEV